MSYESRCPILCSSLSNETSTAEQDGSTFTKYLQKFPKKSDFDASKDGMKWIKNVAYNDDLEKKLSSQTSIITAATFKKSNNYGLWMGVVSQSY